MLANVSIFPLDQGASIRREVAAAVNEVDRSGLDYRLTSMGTIIEGDWDRVMKLVKKIRDRVLKKSKRIYFVITIDEKKDKSRRIDSKVRSVEELLGKKLKK